MTGYFHLFVYGTLRSNGAGAALLADGELIGAGSVGGVLYSIDGTYPALVLYGDSPVAGDVWRCPAETLWSLDEYEGVDSGLFRRIGVNVKLADGRELGCWTYVAGPKLSQKLVPARRIEQWA